jgi:hypothetical protein
MWLCGNIGLWRVNRRGISGKSVKDACQLVLNGTSMENLKIFVLLCHLDYPAA